MYSMKNWEVDVLNLRELAKFVFLIGYLLVCVAFGNILI